MKRNLIISQIVFSIGLVLVLLLWTGQLKTKNKNQVRLNEQPIYAQSPVGPVGEYEATTLPNRLTTRQRYDNLNSCTAKYASAIQMMENEKSYDYSLPADESLHSQTIVRGVLFFFPRDNSDHFMPEFKWLFRSWVEMLKTSPKLWHTDLVVFADLTNYKQHKVFETFEAMGCRIGQPRANKTERSMCIVINFLSISDRVVDNNKWKNDEALFKHLHNEVDVFSDEPANLRLFYTMLKELQKYKNMESILVAFDGYKDLKDLYDFVLRTDIDTFLTPLFGKWLPRYCNDFVVGQGGYSTEFNTARLGRIARSLGLNYAFQGSIGSTWYSTPKQFRVVSYLSLISMIYLYANEFTEPDRQGQIGVANWPDWHFGVLSMYGAHLAVNHYWDQKKINFAKLNAFFDQGTSGNNHRMMGLNGAVDKVVHLHTWHSEELFSKFKFKEGAYDQMEVPINQTLIVPYCLAMALESKRLSPAELKAMRDKIFY
jgi:hypothetical protein